MAQKMITLMSGFFRAQSPHLLDPNIAPGIEYGIDYGIAAVAASLWLADRWPDGADVFQFPGALVYCRTRRI